MISTVKADVSQMFLLFLIKVVNAATRLNSFLQPHKHLDGSRRLLPFIKDASVSPQVKEARKDALK